MTISNVAAPLAKTPSMIRTYIFDFDGTNIYSEPPSMRAGSRPKPSLAKKLDRSELIGRVSKYSEIRHSIVAIHRRQQKC